MIDCFKILMLFLVEDKTTGVKPADSRIWEQAQVPRESHWGQLQGCKEAAISSLSLIRRGAAALGVKCKERPHEC